MSAGVSTLSHKCHKEETFSEVNFTLLSGELGQLPTNDKKGYSEPIWWITDRAMSSQQVVIHNRAGDSCELFPYLSFTLPAPPRSVIVVPEISLWHLRRGTWLTFLGASNYLWTFGRQRQRKYSTGESPERITARAGAAAGSKIWGHKKERSRVFSWRITRAARRPAVRLVVFRGSGRLFLVR